MAKGFFSRGFTGRRRAPEQAGRLPPGQYLTDGFPVLSAGPTPYTPKDRWDFSVVGAVETPQRWTWDELQKLSREPVTAGCGPTALVETVATALVELGPDLLRVKTERF